jgi:hypothetical protein
LSNGSWNPLEQTYPQVSFLVPDSVLNKLTIG